MKVKYRINLCLLVLSLISPSLTFAQIPVTVQQDGLKIRDLKVGTGEEALIGKKLVVDYTGWILKRFGKKGPRFDSTYDKARHFEFRLGAGEVIAGWEEGLVGMRVGGERELKIPARLAYGSQRVGRLIKPNSNLIFEIKLLEVKP